MSSQRATQFALIAFSLLLGACSFQFQAGMSANSRANRRQAAQPTRATTPPKPQPPEKPKVIVNPGPTTTPPGTPRP